MLGAVFCLKLSCTQAILHRPKKTNRTGVSCYTDTLFTAAKVGKLNLSLSRLSRRSGMSHCCVCCGYYRQVIMYLHNTREPVRFTRDTR